MMMSSTSKNRCEVKSGTIIEGKWYKRRYTVIRKLGEGMTGIVYLASLNGQFVALKLSADNMSIMSEVNVLKSFQKVQGSTLGPSLLDFDDYYRSGEKLSFYVMEYIQGPTLLKYLNRANDGWLVVLISQLLSDLEVLHNNGWVFGDLKPDNLIVSNSPPRIRCIDVGGTTIEGRAIKEYTEFFDRGYWGLGSRKADRTYDLFAVAMIMVNSAYPHRFSKQEGGLDQLKKMLQQTNKLTPYEPVIIRALAGKYKSATEMRTNLLTYANKSSKGTPATSQTSRRSNNANKSSLKKQPKKLSGWQSFLETSVITLTILLIYFFYLYSKVI